MTAQPWTARRLFHALRRAGVVLTARGDRLAFDAPAGAMTSDLLGALKARKAELLAVLAGEYVRAALALVLAEPESGRREVLAEWFDERAAVAEFEGDMARGEAERSAWVDLSRAVEGGWL